jgi:hypothetical protein
MTGEVSKFEIVAAERPPWPRNTPKFWYVVESRNNRIEESWGPYPSEIEAEHAIVRLQRMICR